MTESIILLIQTKDEDMKKSGIEHDDQTQSMNCPLCQNTNSCALNSNQEIEACWCKSVKFPPKSVLIEKQLDGSACICQGCLEKIKQEQALDLKRVD